MIPTIVALIVIGFVLLIAEVFVPGGIVGTVGFLLILGSIYLCFQWYGAGTGALVAITSLVAVFLVFYYGIRSVREGISLESSEQDHSAADSSLADLDGQEGVAESALRPVGIATIGGRRVDVTAEQDYIARGERIKVIKVEWNRVVVRRA